MAVNYGTMQAVIIPGANIEANIAVSGPPSDDYENLRNKPQINGNTLIGNKTNSELGIPTKTSDLDNDSEFVSDADYVHTDNNYTDEEVSKLEGIEAGAEANVQSDWNETDTSSDAYIQNKPTIPAAQVNSDWNASSGVAEILHKPTLGTAAAKDYTSSVLENSTDLVESGAVKTAIDNAISSVYKPAGNKACAELVSALLIAANLGNVYNMTDDGVTTADFVEGAGKAIEAGDNVVIVDIGSSVYKFDLLSGMVDLSNYVQKSSTAGLIKNDGTIDTNSYATTSQIPDISGKADKVTNATSGNLAGLNGYGNLTDSGVAANNVVKKSGDTMTGTLQIQTESIVPTLYLRSPAKENVGRGIGAIYKNTSSTVDNGTLITDYTWGETTKRTVLTVRDAASLTDKLNLTVRDSNGTSTNYKVFGEHNSNAYDNTDKGKVSKIGTTDISGIADGTLTGAIDAFANTILGSFDYNAEQGKLYYEAALGSPYTFSLQNGVLIANRS